MAGNDNWVLAAQSTWPDCLIRYASFGPDKSEAGTAKTGDKKRASCSVATETERRVEVD